MGTDLISRKLFSPIRPWRDAPLLSLLGRDLLLLLSGRGMIARVGCGMHYFDHNATTPLSEAAKAAWLDAVERFPGNPSSPHRVGSRADRALTDAREELAEWLQVQPLDLIWTSGATEASNQIFHHYAQSLGEEGRVLVSAIEHPCVLEAASWFFGDRVDLIPVSHQGVIDLEWLENSLERQRPGLVAVMAANNETGVLQPWQRVNELCRRAKVPFFCDAAQWIGKCSPAGLGQCDWLIGCAHKFGGPKGVGFLKCPSKGRIKPLLHGGPQEYSRRAGTENVAGAVALVAALRERKRLGTDSEIRRLEGLRDAFEARVLKSLEGTVVVANQEARLWNTVSLILPNRDCRFRWVVKLDRLGFAVSTGSACSSGKEKPSHVLSAMGFQEEAASRVIRCSSGPDTKESDWLALAGALERLYREQLDHAIE